MPHIRAILLPKPEKMSVPSYMRKVERADFLLVPLRRVLDAFVSDVPYLIPARLSILRVLLYVIVSTASKLRKELILNHHKSGDPVHKL